VDSGCIASAAPPSHNDSYIPHPFLLYTPDYYKLVIHSQPCISNKAASAHFGAQYWRYKGSGLA
jgi:hypothetical protein